jgi:hypothetical protein
MVSRRSGLLAVPVAATCASAVLGLRALAVQNLRSCVSPDAVRLGQVMSLGGGLSVSDAVTLPFLPELKVLAWSKASPIGTVLGDVLLAALRRLALGERLREIPIRGGRGPRDLGGAVSGGRSPRRSARTRAPRAAS